MSETQRFEHLGVGANNNVPLSTIGKTTSIALTFNHLVTMVANLKDTQNRCLTEHDDQLKKPN